MIEVGGERASQESDHNRNQREKILADKGTKIRQQKVLKHSPGQFEATNHSYYFIIYA